MFMLRFGIFEACSNDYSKVLRVQMAANRLVKDSEK
jgi:hypothetical protein